MSGKFEVRNLNSTWTTFKKAFLRKIKGFQNCFKLNEDLALVSSSTSFHSSTSSRFEWNKKGHVDISFSFFPLVRFFSLFFCNFTVINYSPKITFSPSVNQTPEECTMRRCTVRPFFCAAFAQNMSSSRFDISSHQQDFETKLIFWIDRVDFLCLASFGLQNRKRPMNREVVNLIQCETLKATMALQWISSTSSCDRMSWKLSQYSLPQLTFYLIDERPITRRKSKRNSTLLDNKTIIFFASALFIVLSVIETL